MSGHTPGPWKLGARYPESHWIDVVSQTDERGLPFVSCKHHDEEANARRIVAAVNATAGISVEALEAGGIGELVRSLEAIVAMQALRSGDASGTHMSLATLCEFARETLTKIKGEA